ncbi:high-affinity choline uptake protein BetT [Vibrio maritimus]|uniref:High-affinity choline uptake protein BetT n=1 Tax=Vibrio maritimus TaxID=990268 RepID=A0A090T333_9VIBR|nr:high-affinity choline uptake protein BetT [Vibrio maritimus]
MSNSNTVEACSAASISAYDAIHPPERIKSLAEKLEMNNPVFWLSGSFLTLFVLLALTHPIALSNAVNSGFDLATRYFGAFWQLLLLANFVIGLALCFGRTGDVRLGGMARPDVESFKWMSIVLCTLLAGGGVFWAAAEPIATTYLRHRYSVLLHQKPTPSTHCHNHLCTGAFSHGQSLEDYRQSC